MNFAKWWRRNNTLILVFVSAIAAIAVTIFIYLTSKDWTAAGTVALAGFGAVGIVFNCITLSYMKHDRRPYVYVDLMPMEKSPYLFEVVIGNAGSAPAHNIIIKIEAPETEAEMLKKNAIKSKMAELPIIKNPITFLPPGSGRHTWFGSGHLMYEYAQNIEYKVHIQYESSDGTVYKNDITLNLSHMFGITYTEEPYLRELSGIKKELSKLNDFAKSLSESQKIQSGEYGLCVKHGRGANQKTNECIVCRADRNKEK